MFSYASTAPAMSPARSSESPKSNSRALVGQFHFEVFHPAGLERKLAMGNGGPERHFGAQVHTAVGIFGLPSLGGIVCAGISQRFYINELMVTSLFVQRNMLRLLVDVKPISQRAFRFFGVGQVVDAYPFPVGFANLGGVGGELGMYVAAYPQDDDQERKGFIGFGWNYILIQQASVSIGAVRI